MENNNKIIKITKTTCILNSTAYGSIMILGIFLTIYFACSMFDVSKNSYYVLKVFMCMLSIVVFSVLSISMLAEVLSSIKLCGLEFHLQEESLILLKKQEKYNINKEDSKVLYCMMGWLIVWPSGEKINVLLLRKGFLGTQSEKLGLYFKSKMNYISSKKERQETLKKLGINRLNPIKYIKWPA